MLELIPGESCLRARQGDVEQVLAARGAWLRPPAAPLHRLAEPPRSSLINRRQSSDLLFPRCWRGFRCTNSRQGPMGLSVTFGSFQPPGAGEGRALCSFPG